ncbi:hypothetical protein PsalMR5_00748 [Piscirickettsia salmonis]|uniref:hypothetical protein n=1 Tax=Piscirickettsia salmonis TaxID=1238 RepID=UPI0012BB004E|nr:hypothetical protein [Piscirickettsia salmonis]QGP60740.1 hypothetical protein PsalBI1_03361 [Piscirickettsia salmonis]QGP62907.1 hypothetical protein PsalMR5_00748 [Piscirickettsia salmonis]
MKFGQILQRVQPGDLSSINAHILKELGQRYLNQYPEAGLYFSGHHSQQDKALELVAFACQNPALTPDKYCNKLIDLMSELTNASGWLSDRITRLLNKVLQTHILKSNVITGVNPQIKLRDVKDIARDFRVILHTLTRAEEAHQAQAPQQGEMILQVPGQEPVRLIQQQSPSLSPEFATTDWQAGPVRRPTASYLGTDLFLNQPAAEDLDMVTPDQGREPSPGHP